MHHGNFISVQLLCIGRSRHRNAVNLFISHESGNFCAALNNYRFWLFSLIINDLPYDELDNLLTFIGKTIDIWNVKMRDVIVFVLMIDSFFILDIIHESLKVIWHNISCLIYSAVLLSD